MMEISPFIWLGIAIFMALIEVFTLGLITGWFVIGGLAAFVANLLGADIIVQCIVFVVVSIACLVILRPFALKYRNRGIKEEQTFIGQTALVTEAIDNEKLQGRVETANKMTWAARSKDGSIIEVGTPVVVVAQESIKFIVERKSSC